MESTADGELISPSLIDLPRSSDSIEDFVRIGTPTQDSLVEVELNLSLVDDITREPSVISKEPTRVTTPRLSEHFDFEYIHPIDWANPDDLANLENSSQVQTVENVGQSATQTNNNTNDDAPSSESKIFIEAAEAEATHSQDAPTEEEPLAIKIFHGEPGLFFAVPKRQGSVTVLEADADMPLPSAESLISTLSDTLIGDALNGDTETLQGGDQAQHLEPIKVLFQSLATKIQTRHALSTLFWIILPSLAVVYAAVLAQTPSVATPSASSNLQPPPVITIPLELQKLADLPIHSTASHEDSKDASSSQTDLPPSVNSEPSVNSPRPPQQSANPPSENTAAVVKSLSVIKSTSSSLSLLSKAPANPTSAIPPRPSQTCSAHRLAASTTTTIVAQTKLRVAQPPYRDLLASLLQNMTDNSSSNSQCITSNTSIQIPALRGRFTYRCGSPRGFGHHPTVLMRQSRQQEQFSSPSSPPLLLSDAPATSTSMRKTCPMKHQQHNCHRLRQRKQQQQQKQISPPPPTFLIDGTYPSTQSKSTTPSSSALLALTHLYNSKSLTDATNWCLTHVRAWVRWVLGGAHANEKAQEWMRKVKHNMATVKESIALRVAQVEAWAEEEFDALEKRYAFVRREARALAKGWVVKAERQMEVAGDLMVRAVGEMIAILPWVG